MSRDRRTGPWAQVKAGDKVAVARPGWAREYDWSVQTVERVTPSGIVVCGRDRYRPAGEGSSGVLEGQRLRAVRAYPLSEKAQIIRRADFMAALAVLEAVAGVALSRARDADDVRIPDDLREAIRRVMAFEGVRQ